MIKQRDKGFVFALVFNSIKKGQTEETKKEKKKEKIKRKRKKRRKKQVNKYIHEIYGMKKSLLPPWLLGLGLGIGLGILRAKKKRKSRKLFPFLISPLIRSLPSDMDVEGTKTQRMQRKALQRSELKENRNGLQKRAWNAKKN